MGARRALGDAELVGDLLVRCALGQLRQDLLLARGEGLDRLGVLALAHALGEQPHLELSATSLTFTATEGGSAPKSQTVTVSDGKLAVIWTDVVQVIVLLGGALACVGVILFEITGWRPVLFIFPNLFEHWFLFYLFRNWLFPGVRLDSWRRIATWLVILYIPKLGQEYLLHVAEAQPWDWIKGKLGL